MLRTIVFTAALLCAGSAFAADAPAPTAKVELTANEMKVVSVALELAAGTCATVPDGCAIGLNKAPIQAKLGAATLAPKPEGK